MAVEGYTTPFTVQTFADEAEIEPRDTLAMAREHGVRMVDFKFTDLPGTWQHVSLSIHGLDEDAFEEGLGFDGSSIRGFQEISESDMILVPDPSTAVIDPFYEQQTMSIICNIFDPITREPYSRDPRYVAQKAEGYLIETGIADICYMGPEAEFFIFDHVAFDQTVNRGFYEVDSAQGFWNRGAGSGAERRTATEATSATRCAPRRATFRRLRATPTPTSGRAWSWCSRKWESRASSITTRFRPAARRRSTCASTSCCAWATTSRPTST